MFLPTSNAQLTYKKVLEIPYINQGNFPDCVSTSFYMAIQAVSPKPDESIYQIIHQIKEYDGLNVSSIPTHKLLNSYIKNRTGVEADHSSCSVVQVSNANDRKNCINHIDKFIKNNIDQGRPVVLSSTGWLISAQGHAVLVIGYEGDDTYYIHNPGAGDRAGTGISQRYNIHKDVYRDQYFIMTATVIPKSLDPNRSLLNATVENKAFAFISPGARKPVIDYQANRTIPELYEFVDNAQNKYDSIPWDYPVIRISNLGAYQNFNASNADKTAYLKIDIGREDCTEKLPSIISDRGTISPYNLGNLGMGQITKNVEINKLRDPDKQVDCYFEVSFYDDNDSLFHQRKISFKLDPGHFDFVQSKLVRCNEYEFSLFDIQIPPMFQKVVYEFENQQTGFKDTVETTNKDGNINYVFSQAGTYKIVTKVITGGHNDIYQESETEITIKEETVDFNVSNEGNKYTFKSAGGCQLEDVSYNWEITDSGDKEVYSKNNETYASHTFTDSGNYTVTLKAINSKTSKINGINSKKITVSITEDLSSKAKEAFEDKNWAELFNLYRAAKMDSDKIIIKDYLHKLAIEFHNTNTKHLQDFKEHRTNIDTSYNAFEAKSNRDRSRLEEAIKVTKAGSPERISLQKQFDDLKQCERATNRQYQNDLSYTATAIQIFEKLAGYDYTTAIKWLTAGPGIVLSDGHIAFFKKNDVKQLDIGYDLTKPIPKPDYSSYCINSRILEIPPLPFIKIRASKTEARAGEIVELKAVLVHPPDGKGGRIVHTPDAEYDDTEIISWTGSNIIATHQHPASRYESSRSFMATESGEYVIKATADGYKPASITISVGGARTSGEILGLDKNREFFGATKEITYLARTGSGNAPITGLNYSQTTRWDSSPGLLFTPKEIKGSGEDGIKTRVTFSRILNPTKIWAEIFWQYKDGESKVKSPVREVEVVSPDFSLKFDPPAAQAKVGEPLTVTVESQPRVPNNLIEYRWVEPTDRKELDNGVIEIIPKDNKPINFHVIARVPAYGDVVNDNIKGQYISGANKVTASLVGPKYDKDSQEWSETKKGLETKKPPLVTGQEIIATVVVEDIDNEKLTYRWESNEGCSIHHGQYSRDVTVYRNEPGDCILKVTAYDKDKNILGTDDLTISISEQGTTTTTISDTPEEQVTTTPGVDLDSQQGQAQQQAREQAAQEAISEAQNEATKGNFDKAISAAEKAKALDPDNKKYQEQLQAIKDKKDKTSTTIAEVKESLTQNEFKKAETLIKEIEKDIPQSTITHELNAELDKAKKSFVEKTLTDSNANIKKGNLEVAIRNLEKAASADPDNKEVGNLLTKSKENLQKIKALHDHYKQAMNSSDYKSADKILKEMQAVNRYHPDVVAAQSALFSGGQQKRSELANKLYEADELIRQGEIDQAITVLEYTLSETDSVNEATSIRTDLRNKLEYLINKKNIADISLKDAERLINAGYKYYDDANRLIDNALLALPTYKPAIALKERMNALFAQQKDDLKKQNELSQEAFQQLNNCDYDKATELIEEAKALNPDNVEIAKNAFDINTKRKAFLESINRARMYIMKGDTNLAQMELNRHDKTCSTNSDYKRVQESFDNYKAAVKKEVEELLNLITKAISQKNPALARQHLYKLKNRKDLPDGAEPVLKDFEQLIDNLENQLKLVDTLDKLVKQPVPQFTIPQTHAPKKLPPNVMDYMQSQQNVAQQKPDVKVLDNALKELQSKKQLSQPARVPSQHSTPSIHGTAQDNYSAPLSQQTQPTTSRLQSTSITNMVGDWDTEYSNGFRGTLKITQQSGNKFSGTIQTGLPYIPRSSTYRGIDKIYGIISGNQITYTRTSREGWQQNFAGTIHANSPAHIWIKGSVTGTGITSKINFYDQKKISARKISGTSSSIKPAQTGQSVSTSSISKIQTSSETKTIHIVFKNQSSIPVHFYGMGQKPSAKNKVMPQNQVNSTIKMAIPETKYYAGPGDQSKKIVTLKLDTLKQGQTVTLIYNTAGHFFKSP
jgi:tetratricopeptide (TPR) repeat protein